MTKLELGDTITDALYKMSESNPGALTVCVELLKEVPQIDPDASLGGIGYLLNLDTLNLYGSRIWCLYKDVCGEDLTKTCAVLRAWQLSHLSKTEIDRAVNNRGDGIDPDAVLGIVQLDLPAFGQPPEKEGDHGKPVR